MTMNMRLPFALIKDFLNWTKQRTMKHNNDSSLSLLRHRESLVELALLAHLELAEPLETLVFLV